MGLYVESKIWHKLAYLWDRNRIMGVENRLVAAKAEGVGEGRSGSFDLADVTFYI